MARGGARVGAGRPKKDRSGDVSRTVAAGAVVDAAVLPPLDYMLAVIRDPNLDQGRRDRMAVAAAPYLHTKLGEGGKKAQKTDAARKVSDKFQPASAPKLVVNNAKGR